MKPSQAIERLVAAGWSQDAIAKCVGTSQPTIHRIKNGDMPTYAIGVALIATASKLPKKRKHTRLLRQA